MTAHKNRRHIAHAMATKDEIDIEQLKCSLEDGAWSRYSTVEPDDQIDEFECPTSDASWTSTSDDIFSCSAEDSKGCKHREDPAYAWLVGMLKSLIDERMSHKFADHLIAEERLPIADLSSQVVHPTDAQPAECEEKAVFLDLLASHIPDAQIFDLVDLLGDVSGADGYVRATFMEDLWQRRRKRESLDKRALSSGYKTMLLTDLVKEQHMRR